MEPAGNNQPESLTRTLGGLRIVSGCTFLSRILGLVRDMLMASTFGNSAALDAFTVAFRIPNMARRLFGEGALTAAFLPLFVREIDERGQLAAWKLATSVLVLLLIVLSVLVLVGEGLLLAGWLLVEPGSNVELLLEVTAVMLPYLVTICLTAQISAILNGMDHFAVPAFIPIVLNSVWIAALLWIVPQFPETSRMHVVAASVVVAGCLQLLAPLPTLRRLQFRFELDVAGTRNRIQELVRAMLPVLLGLSITQLNTVADSVIAWGLSSAEWVAEGSAWRLETGTASALYFGQRLYQFPLGVFGIALGTVLFPRMSRHAARRNLAALRDDLGLGLQLIMGIGLPASAGLMLLSRPLASLLFEYGEFTSRDAEQTSAMIRAYGCGVWAYCGLLIVSRSFYAVNDRQTPLRAGFAALCLNLPLNFVMVRVVGGVGLALATSISAAFQVAILLWQFNQTVIRCRWAELFKAATKATAATLVMCAACYGCLQLLPTEDDPWTRCLRVGLPFAVSVAVYFACAALVRLDVVWLLVRRDRAGEPPH